MTIIVSVSQFRQNLSDYLAKAQAGHTVVVKDEKKGDEMVEIVGKKKWDPEAYKGMLRRVAGTISAKNHPEWATPKKINQWLRKERLAAERRFDVPPRH